MRQIFSVPTSETEKTSSVFCWNETTRLVVCIQLSRFGSQLGSQLLTDELAWPTGYGKTAQFGSVRYCGKNGFLGFRGFCKSKFSFKRGSLKCITWLSLFSINNESTSSLNSTVKNTPSTVCWLVPAIQTTVPSTLKLLSPGLIGVSSMMLRLSIRYLFFIFLSHLSSLSLSY